MIASYSIKDVSFSYSNQPVLTINTLDIPASSVIALVGPNGSGKTTLLHLLAFLIIPQKGLLSFLGAKVSASDLINLRRRVGLLPQNPYLFKCSVLENVAIGLKLRGFSRREAKKMAIEGLKKVRMEGYESRWPNSLSGGEAQRVALARTLALNPEVFLFDEPANHLDLESVKRTEQLILNLNRNEKKTVVFTSHNLAFAQNLTDFVIHIFQGQVVPTAPYNLFRGQIQHGGKVFDAGAVQFDISKTTERGTCLMVDPSKISFSTQEEFVNLPNVFHGRIVSISLLRDVVKIEALAGEKFEIHAPISLDLASLGIGKDIWLHIGPNAMTLI
ncbi:MAG: ABC transporter ATP-binding protein [Desulfomonilaceae bacterium]